MTTDDLKLALLPLAYKVEKVPRNISVIVIAIGLEEPAPIAAFCTMPPGLARGILEEWRKQGYPFE